MRSRGKVIGHVRLSLLPQKALMGVVSSVYKSTPAKNCLIFASSQKTPATSAINHAFVSATPINHTYSQLNVLTVHAQAKRR